VSNIGDAPQILSAAPVETCPNTVGSAEQDGPFASLIMRCSIAALQKIIGPK